MIATAWNHRRGMLPGLLAMIVLTPGCRHEDPAELLYAARSNFAAGRLEEAEDRLARLARLRPLTVPERVFRAQVAQDRGRTDDALEALRAPHGGEPQQGPEAALLSAWRGWLEMERHRFRSAEGHLKRALELEPDRAQARRQLIDLYAIQRRQAEAAEQAHRLARSETLEFPYLYLWTLGEREGMDPAEQAAMLEDAVRADPDDRASRLAMVETLRRLGRLDAAEAALEPLSPDDPDTRVLAARIALDRAEVEAAEAILARGTDHDNVELAVLRGRLAMLREDAATAVRQFQAAIQADPESRDAHFGLGQALRLTGQAEAARPHFQAARDRERLEWLVRGARPPGQRNNPALLQEIGAACLAIGRRDLARAWYRQALHLAPGDARIESALSRLGPDS
jgi:tetratricopeptide (TPR) repeat protein